MFDIRMRESLERGSTTLALSVVLTIRDFLGVSRPLLGLKILVFVQGRGGEGRGGRSDEGPETAVSCDNRVLGCG